MQPDGCRSSITARGEQFVVMTGTLTTLVLAADTESVFVESSLSWCIIESGVITVITVKTLASNVETLKVGINDKGQNH